MSETGEQFLSWANDPARTLEEQYGILRLVEEAYSRYYRGADKQYQDWRAMAKSREKRLYNPAFRPRIDPKLLQITADLLEGIKEMEIGYSGEDRPVRDFGFFAFLPNLTALKLGGFERADLGPLQHLPGLRDLRIHGGDLEDYSALAACRELREIHINTQHPWPKLRVLSKLPHLEKLTWHGNGRALADIPALPALKSLHIESVHYSTDVMNSIRDLHQLPEMPVLDHFWGGWFYRLDGIERYPRLRFLALRGYFKSLAGMEKLTALTHLRLICPRLEEVATIASMPSVLHLALHSERPQDWGVLMESETLREVFHLGFDGDQPDLETLRMLIPSSDGFFQAPEPRPLEPIRLLVRGNGDEGHGADILESAEYPEGEDGWHGNLAMRQSEFWWVQERLHSALRDAGYLKLRGVRMEVKPPELYSLFVNPPQPWDRRMLSITLLKTEAIGHMPGIFECLRKALSGVRYPWRLYVTLQPDPDADTWDESWKLPRLTYAEEMEELNAELEYKRLRKQILLSDQHRMQLLQELGEDVENFQPSPLPKRPDSIHYDNDDSEDDEDEDQEEDGDDDAEGGVAFFDPDQEEKDDKWLPPVDVGDPNRDWNNLFCMFQLTEKGIHMHSRNRGLEAIADLLDIVPEHVD